MPGIKPFLAGMLAGGCLSCAALQYHVVRSDEGMYLVPRNPKPSLTLAYMDTRGWAREQWDRHPELVDAVRAKGADKLLSDETRVSRDEIQDAMQRSLDDPVLFEADDDVDSGMIVNKPAHQLHESIDDPVETHRQRSNSGFLDEVRSELNGSFGNQSDFNDNRKRHSENLNRDVGISRDRRDSIGNDWHDDTFSDTLYDPDSSLGDLSDSDDPYSIPESSNEIRRRSFESDPGNVDQYVPAPKFDEDDDILNRFAPRSGAAQNRGSVVTFDDESWMVDPWAQTSHATNMDNVSGYRQTESSPGWQPTQRTGSANHAMSGILDRLNSAAGAVARETIDRTRRAVTSPRGLYDTTDSTGNSTDEARSFDEDGLYSPFAEVDN